MAARMKLVAPALDPVADLKRRLPRGAPPRRCVKRWWNDHDLGTHPAAVGKRIALALLEQQRIEHQQAGILVMQELLADHLRASDLPAFEQLFTRGQLSDGAVVDGLGVRVLGTMLHHVHGRAEMARALLHWRNADSIWQRRAACAAFTAIAPQGNAALPELAQMIFTLCSTIVWSPERLDQSAVAWLLRELSRAEPARVEAFFRRHARFMSRDCARGAIARLPAARQKELLAHHKRATTLSR